MEDHRIESLENRLAAVESALEATESRLRDLEAWKRQGDERRAEMIRTARDRMETRTEPARTVPRPTVIETSWARFVDAVTGEGAIGRIGAVLIVLGSLYGVQYGIDRGWIVPAVRVAGAALLGMVLILLSFRVGRTRALLSGLLAGSGLASLYVAVFAAQALYGLVSFPAGLALVSVVTLAGFGLGEWRQDPSVAILGAFGGMLTPFILQTETASLPGLVTYLGAVMLGVGVLYARHGWRSLILFEAAIALPVAAVVYTLLDGGDPTTMADRWATQVGLFLAVGSFMWLPVYRTRPAASLPALPPWMPAPVARVATASLVGATLVTVWFFEHLSWDLEAMTWGLSGLVVLAVTTAWYEFLWKSDQKDFAISLRMGQVIVAIFVFVELMDGYGGAQIALVAGLSLLLVVDAARRPARHPGVLAVALWAVTGFWFVVRMGEVEPTGWPLLSADGAGDLAALALVWLGVRRQSGPRDGTVLQILILVGLLALTGREFVDPGALTTAWAVIAVSLLILGYRFASYPARMSGLAVLALVVLKLLLIDLASTDPLIRILLFLGIGGILMFMSYVFPSLFRHGSAEDAAE